MRERRLRHLLPERIVAVMMEMEIEGTENEVEEERVSSHWRDFTKVVGFWVLSSFLYHMGPLRAFPFFSLSKKYLLQLH